jgi:hypothetical protein
MVFALSGIPASYEIETVARGAHSRRMGAGNTAPEDTRPGGINENRLGPSEARTRRGGELFAHGANSWAIIHRPMAASRSTALGVSGFQNDLVRST